MNKSKQRAFAKVEALLTPAATSYIHDNGESHIGHYSWFRIVPIARAGTDPTFDLAAFDPFISLVIDAIVRHGEIDAWDAAACCVKDSFLMPPPACQPNRCINPSNYPKKVEAPSGCERHTENIREDIAYNHARYTLSALRALDLVSVHYVTKHGVHTNQHVYGEPQPDVPYTYRSRVFRASAPLKLWWLARAAAMRDAYLIAA